MSKLHNITIFTRGGRGDFQPYLAIAIALKNKGYNVRMIANPNFKSTTESFGIPFVSAGVGFDDAFKKNKLIVAAMENGDTQTLFRALGDLNKQDAPNVSKAIVQDLQDHRPDLIIKGSLSDYFAFYAAIRMDIPFIDIGIPLFVFSSKRALLGLPNLPFELNRVLMNFLGRLFFSDLKNYDKILNETIMDSNKLTAVNAMASKIPRVNLTSPTVASVLFGPNDVGDHIQFIGSPIIPKESQLTCKDDGFGNAQDKKEIEDFLSKGDCIYMGWGSMISGPPHQMAEFAVRAAQKANQRAIILGGFAEISIASLLEKHSSSDNTNSDYDSSLIEYARKNILFVNKAPHEWLFPKVTVIVHHGGAGTTNAALRSGRPMIVTPVMMDQWDHAHVANELGIGIGFEKKNLQKITWQELGDAIERVVLDDKMAKHANEIGKVVRNENSAEKAVNAIERYWVDVVETGEFVEKHFPFPDAPTSSSTMTTIVMVSACVVVLLLAVAVMLIV